LAIQDPVHSEQSFDHAVRNRTGPARLCTRSRQGLRQRWTDASCLIVLAFITTSVAQQPVNKFSGVVSDTNGAAIANASVEFEANGSSVRTVTDVAGNFAVLSTEAYGT